MTDKEHSELCNRIVQTARNGALEQARILVRRIHSSGRQLPLILYRDLPADIFE